MSIWTTIRQMLARKKRPTGSSNIRGIAKLFVRPPSVRRSARCLMTGSGRCHALIQDGTTVNAWSDEFTDDFGPRGL